MNFEIYEAGGAGAISVTGNVAPGRVSAVWDAFRTGDAAEARRLHEELDRLNRAMFIETNPMPVKAALSMMARCAEEYRLPLTPLSEGHRNELRDILKQEGLI
jgi:4-hydroxy-tetrahydrodipicolinate synthase